MTILIWIGFLTFILAMLAIDLGVFHRKQHVISIREALAWSIVWIALSLLFNVGVYFMYEHHIFGIGIELGHNVGGKEAAIDYFTGYVIEKSLSLDNIFVIALVFTYFRVPPEYQHRVLFWGILGAMIMRGIMIALGVALITRFDWIVYVFGGILVLTAIKMLVMMDKEIDPSRNPLVRLARYVYPVSPGYDGQKFFTLINGRRAITPMFLVLLVIESMDVLFAVDSIPAIFAITHDPFIVFTSNIFAILGLRALYFALAGVLYRFRYVKYSLIFILIYVGVKMILSHHYPIPTLFSLALILVTLAVGMIASVVLVHRKSTGCQSPESGR
jgi:tellurite resistance protein TerC